MGSGIVGNVIGGVLGMGSQMYSQKQQSNLEKENLALQREQMNKNDEIAKKQLANQELETKRATAKDELEQKRVKNTELKRRSNMFQRTNYANEDFGTSILG